MIREIMDMYKREKKQLYLVFLDIEKAYDKMDRRSLMIVLEKLGVPRKIKNLLKGMYENTKAKYIFGDIETDWVHLKKGVRQGCVLSPLLFNMYTEELSKRIKQEGLGIKIGNEKLGALLYADDVVLIAEDKDMAQELMNVAVDLVENSA